MGVFTMNKEDNQKEYEKTEGDDNMNTAMVERYCTISESLIKSSKEVKLMRTKDLPKKSWAALKAELKKIKEEVE